MSLKKFVWWLIAAALSIAGPLHADDEAAEVSEDGLEVREVSNLRSVYARPGATLAPYKRIALLDCFVEFRKGWQRSYNSQVRGAGRRITDEDMERIKKEVAEEFRKVFTEELETEGGYEIVDVAGPDVLLLRPAIINLVVTAPDKRAPGRYTTIVDSAGQMTLYLELYDSASNELIGRVVDPREVRSAGGFARSSSVRNKAEADRILRRWADILRDHLDAARSTDASEANR